MKTNVKLYVFVKENAPILTTLEQQNYDYILIKDYETLKSTIDAISYIDSHLLLIDLEYVINSKRIINKNIKKELMRSWLSVIAYSDETPSLKIKDHLYRLDFKAILDNTNKNIHHKIIKHAISYTNIHMEKLQNNVITALANFSDLSTSLRDLQYLLLSVIDYYELSEQDAADIYLVTSSLIVATKTNSLIETSEILFTIFKSLEVNKLYKNYATPKSFNEQIVSTLLSLIKGEQVSINMENVNQKLIDKVTEFYESKTMFISSYMKIDIFWEEISEMLFNQYKNDDFSVVEHYLQNIYHILIHSLNRVNYMHVRMDRNHKKEITVFIKLFHTDDSIATECFDLIEIDQNSMSKNIEKTENGSSELAITLNLSKESASAETPSTRKSKNLKQANIEKAEDENCKLIATPNLSEKLPEVKTSSIRKNGILKQTNINTMHYKEEEKISAHVFLKEFEMDNYVLDDLNDNEIEIKDSLFSEEELNDTALENVSIILSKYVSILHETIEFNDLAISLESLSKVFQRFSVNMLKEEKKDKLRFFIQGLIDDLQTWKKYIFIDPNTPDIHYLDASLLENCASIEYFIFNDNEDNASTEDDEDDLEFF